MAAAREPVVRPVGRVQTDYASPAATPVQTRRNPDAVGRVELDARDAPILEGLAGFDYVWLLSWLDPAAAPDTDGRVTPLLLRHPGRRLGLFATRHPARPNPIGLSAVRFVGIEGATLHFRGVDLTDGTPVLDVKPWQQQLDVPCWDEGADAVAAIRGGWLPEAGPGTARLTATSGRGPGTQDRVGGCSRRRARAAWSCRLVMGQSLRHHGQGW